MQDAGQGLLGEGDQTHPAEPEGQPIHIRRLPQRDQVNGRPVGTGGTETPWLVAQTPGTGRAQRTGCVGVRGGGVLLRNANMNDMDTIYF